MPLLSNHEAITSCSFMLIRLKTLHYIILQTHGINILIIVLFWSMTEALLLSTRYPDTHVCNGHRFTKCRNADCVIKTVSYLIQFKGERDSSHLSLPASHQRCNTPLATVILKQIRGPGRGEVSWPRSQLHWLVGLALFRTGFNLDLYDDAYYNYARCFCCFGFLFLVLSELDKSGHAKSARPVRRRRPKWKYEVRGLVSQGLGRTPKLMGWIVDGFISDFTIAFISISSWW